MGKKHHYKRRNNSLKQKVLSQNHLSVFLQTLRKKLKEIYKEVIKLKEFLRCYVVFILSEINFRTTSLQGHFFFCEGQCHYFCCGVS